MPDPLFSPICAVRYTVAPCGITSGVPHGAIDFENLFSLPNCRTREQPYGLREGGPLDGGLPYGGRESCLGEARRSKRDRSLAYGAVQKTYKNDTADCSLRGGTKNVQKSKKKPIAWGHTTDDRPGDHFRILKGFC